MCYSVYDDNFYVIRNSPGDGTQAL